MDDTPLSVLLAALFLLIVLSAFFSGSETGLMTINRYRLRNMADNKHPGAMRAQKWRCSWWCKANSQKAG